VHNFFLFFFFYNQSSVGLKIGSEFVRVHDNISIIAVISPELCIVNQPMQPLLNGIASFAHVVFSGFIGQCTIHFKAYFHDSSNIPAAHEQSLNTTIRVIASSMTLGTKLQQEELVGGKQYSFTSNSKKDTQIFHTMMKKTDKTKQLCSRLAPLSSPSTTP
jgi:hypothetical protein